MRRFYSRLAWLARFAGTAPLEIEGRGDHPPDQGGELKLVGYEDEDEEDWSIVRSATYAKMTQTRRQKSMEYQSIHIVAGLLAFGALIHSPAVGAVQVSDAVQIDTATLTPERLNRIADFALAGPDTMAVPEHYARALGLWRQEKPFLARQVVIRNSNGVRNIFNADANGSGKYLLARMGGGPTEFFVIDSKGNLLTAARVESRQLNVLDINDDGVRARFDAEVGVWAKARLADEEP